jgi:hypothetical protein
MRKRTIFLLTGAIILLLGGLGTGLAFLVFHEPAFYRRCSIEPGSARKTLSKACFTRFCYLISCIREGIGDGKDEWAVEFTQEQLNAFFEEDFLNLPEAEELKRKGMSSPRIILEPDRIRLAFRYGNDRWNSIISFDVRVWLAPKEQNVIAIEILGRHAGALPISAQWLLDSLAEQFRDSRNVEVTWYRHEGKPVALLHLQSDRPRATFQLRRLVVDQGRLTIVGLSMEPSSQAALRAKPAETMPE